MKPADAEVVHLAYEAASRAGKRRVLIILFACYTVSYLLRTNLSAVMDRLMADLNLDKVSAGAIGSVFFWTYAAGQVVNGYLASRCRPKRMIALGLGLSALANVSVGLARGFWAMLFLWALNGYFLSMIWPPTLRILSNWFGEAEYGRVSVIMSLPTTVGYVLSWGILRPLVTCLPWRVAFYAPAACALAFLAVWMVLMQGAPDGETAITSRSNKETGQTGRRTPFFMPEAALWLIGFAAMMQGLVKESVNLWGPSMIADVGAAQGESLKVAFSMLIQAASTLGILATGWLLRTARSDGRALRMLFALSALFAGLAWALHSTFAPSIAMVGALMACLCGANAVLTALIPLRYAASGRSTQVAGTLNFLVYTGAGVGGGLSGLVSDLAGWQGAYLLWATLCLAAAVVVPLWERLRSRAA